MQLVTTRLPIIPRSKKDPTRQMRFVRSAESIFEEKLRNIRNYIIEIYRNLPRATIEANHDASLLTNRTYIFDLNEYDMRAIHDDVNSFVEDELNLRDASNWFFDEYVAESYRRGTTAEFVNIAAQSELYASNTLGRRMMSDAYRKRVALVRYRVFEEMQGFTATTRKNLGRVLSDAIANGSSIQDLTKEIQRQTGVEQSRARRIARTEITTAYRRARWDEAEQAQADYGFRTGMLWSAAFAPTSRRHHLERHGKVYTTAEVREFYSRDANAINCMCSQTSVLIDDSGKPINDLLVRRLNEMRENAKLYGEKLQ